jgi:hypothetical protein
VEVTGVKCDKCGYSAPIPMRAGSTCNQGLPGGGYCDGILQLIGATAPAAVEVPGLPSMRDAFRAKLERFKGSSILKLREDGLEGERLSELASLCRLMGRTRWRVIAHANPDIYPTMIDIERLADTSYANHTLWRDMSLDLADDPFAVTKP